MDDDEILAHMFTIVVAATDTLVVQSIVLLILLAQNPHVQQKVCTCILLHNNSGTLKFISLFLMLSFDFSLIRFP